MNIKKMSHENFLSIYFRQKIEMINKSINELGFENAALTHSISNSSNLGGKLGWINENSLNEEIKKKIISLKKGEFSDHSLYQTDI